MAPDSWPLALIWVPVALFALAIVVGIVVRWFRAPRGTRSRLRHALGPLMSAGEKYQELHTGQRGLQDSIIESIQEQETQGSERGTGDDDGKPGRRVP
ncbi:hypothetical protein ESP57_12490 [Agromyces fucosus]|uniref:Uncharacterized protein n=1 Tax=Agromyces fucosus TaxID=41985 RepID=A0A4Q2JN73_9MICO|nr:hypothetical protein [Agromyces fucosus]RXZ47388.1 hypothetical protein ESP57_12490 [Agromyces fucosus]